MTAYEAVDTAVWKAINAYRCQVIFNMLCNRNVGSTLGQIIC
jgi:hypothetical protein